MFVTIVYIMSAILERNKPDDTNNNRIGINGPRNN